MNSAGPFGDSGGHVRAISNKDYDYVRYVDDENLCESAGLCSAAQLGNQFVSESVQPGINRCFVPRRGAY